MAAVPVPLLVLLLLLAAAASPPPVAEGSPRANSCGSTSGNFTANSTYQTNLLQLASSLPANASSSPLLFATGSVGAVQDKVFGLVLCRGDGNATSCLSCLTAAFQDAMQVCPYNRDATVYEEKDIFCILRYSNQDLSTDTNNDGNIILQNTFYVPSSENSSFDAAVMTLLSAVDSFAADNSTRRFGTGKMQLNGTIPTIYAWSQCTPDMSPDQCLSCLGALTGYYPQYFSAREGGTVLGWRCTFRYEIYPVFTGLANVQLPLTVAVAAPAPSVGEEGKNNNTSGNNSSTSNVIAIVVPVVVVAVAVLLAVILFVVWRNRKSTKRIPLPPHSSNQEIIRSEELLVSLSTILAATCNFDERNKIGQGGFGAVYKGVLSNGVEIAVKRLSQVSRQGIGELRNELNLIIKLQHKNLVKLHGVCLEEGEKLLIYEYLPNKSLDTIIFDPEKHKLLDWRTRNKIINGIARGMQYLHEDSQLKIVHRDLKASNILLDADMTPKISDFGLARLFDLDQSVAMTNRIAGTYGYLAPEYAMRGYFSLKSDVFSFGVILLEIITGRSNTPSSNLEDPQDLLGVVWEHWRRGTLKEIIDPFLIESNSSMSEMLRCIQIGLLCTQENPADRPNMLTIVMMLSSGTVSIQSPSKPAFWLRSNILMSTNEEDLQVLLVKNSENAVSTTELDPR